MKKEKWVKGIQVILLLCALSFAVGCGSKADQPGQEPGEPMDGQQAAEEPQTQSVEFPYVTEDGKLEITSLFQFSGFNPDCEGEEGTDIAALQLHNASSEHLTEAELVLQLESGKSLRFVVKDLPAEGEAMVFAVDNTEMDSQDACSEIAYNGSYETESPVLADKVSVQPEEVQITLTNLSDEDLTDMTVYCHCLLEGISFGGLTYAYPVPKLPAGQSITVDTPDCYLGSAQVVRIELGR